MKHEVYFRGGVRSCESLFRAYVQYALSSPTLPSSCPIDNASQVQFELLFGAIFFRGLTQLKQQDEEFGADEEELSANASANASAPPVYGSFELSSRGREVRSFTDSELEVRAADTTSRSTTECGPDAEVAALHVAVCRCLQ